MECSINIGHFRVNSMTNNANINFQHTYQNSHTANSTIIGGCFNFGDHCTNTCTQNIHDVSVPCVNKNIGDG